MNSWELDSASWGARVYLYLVSLAGPAHKGCGRSQGLASSPTFLSKCQCHPHGPTLVTVREGGTAGTVLVCLAAQTEAGL